MSLEPDPFLRWFEALEKRHLTNLKFAEVRRAVQALSSLYVESRGKLSKGMALDGTGKRAAFAFFFGTLHFLLVRAIVDALGAHRFTLKRILDVGCGTGIAGAAWALSMQPQPAVTGIDSQSWAVQEARWTYRSLGLNGVANNRDIEGFHIPKDTGVIAAFTTNELDPETRDYFLTQCLKTAQSGSPVLVIEPIARRIVPWWDDWAARIKAAGGREDSWRFRTQLPERLALMDRAAGLNHRELTGRSLWLPADPSQTRPHHSSPAIPGAPARDKPLKPRP